MDFRIENEPVPQTKNGKQLPASAVGDPIPIEQDARTGRAERYFEVFSQRVTDYAFITLDTAGRVASWSRGAEHILQYSEAEILGKPSSVFFTPEEIAQGEYEAELATASREGCAEDARFQGPHSSPSLEPQHTDRLADHGPDHPAHVIALCPNFDGRGHFARFRSLLNNSLKSKLRNLDLVSACSQNSHWKLNCTSRALAVSIRPRYVSRP